MTMGYLWIASVLACCLATVLADDDQCPLADIPMQPNFDSSRFTGVWYQVEVYSTQQQNQPWQDFSQRVSEVTGQPGQIRVDTYYRRDRNADCSPVVTSFRNQTRPGYYRDTRETVVEGITADDNVIVYTDYQRFAVEFVCYETYFGNCRDPQVVFWSRTKLPLDDDVGLGRRLLSRLCVDDRQRYQIVQDPVSTCNRNINRQCRLGDIPIANPYSSAAASGIWYVIRYYPGGQLEPSEVTDDFNYKTDGINLISYIRLREPYTNRCNQDIVLKLKEPTSGLFEYFNPVYNKTVVTLVVYASSNRQYGILFTCIVQRGDICIDPEVIFVSRGKPVLTSAELSELEAFIPILCVDPTVYRDPVHRGGCPPSDEESVPTSPPTTDQQDLLRAEKEMLVASRDKFRAETEMLRAQKELIQLQIQHLRSRPPYGK